MRRTDPRVEKSPPRPLGSSRDIQIIQGRGGTPTKYTPEVPDLVYRMVRLGMTIAQTAQHLQVGESTLENWMTHRREVREAYDQGRWESILVVEESLLRRAKGYEYDEVKHYSGVDALGREWSRTVECVKRVESDTTAAIYYTKNRCPERWRDVWNVGQGTNLTQVNINNTLSLDTLSQEDRELVARVSMSRIIGENDIIGEEQQ